MLSQLYYGVSESYRVLDEMGCGASQRSTASAKSSSMGNRKPFVEYEQSFTTAKLLLIGGDFSGKSTIMKQMKIIHTNGFSFEECCFYRLLVYENVIEDIQAITSAMHSLCIDYENPDREEDVSQLPLLVADKTSDTLPVELLAIMKRLWADQGVQKCFSRAREYQLNDSAGYYLSELDRIGAPGYFPTDQDILRARMKKTKIIETRFNIRDLHFRMFDVGGQRSARKKWIHFFEDATAIIFCVALSEYDLVLSEDKETNRMRKSLQMFASICNSQWFFNTSIFLFLNKKDLFAEKIKISPLNACFPEYDGANTFEECGNYVREQFVSLCDATTRRKLFTYFTCALDTANIQFAFDDVADVIIKSRIGNC